MIGEDAEYAVEGKRSLADDITATSHSEMDDATKARITAAQDFYKQHGRPFSPGIRVVSDPTSKIGFSFTTSKSVPKGSGVFHIPGTAYEITVPAFTREAVQGTKLANLVNDAVSNGEFFNTPEMKAVYDYDIPQLTTFFKDAVNKASKEDKIADLVDAADRAEDFSDEALAELASDAMDIIEGKAPTKSMKEQLNERLEEMAKAIRAMEADPNARYADLLHAQDMMKRSLRQGRDAVASGERTKRQACRSKAIQRRDRQGFCQLCHRTAPQPSSRTIRQEPASSRGTQAGFNAS
jgi:methyl-accepting chemotaxis protein